MLVLGSCVRLCCKGCRSQFNATPVASQVPETVVHQLGYWYLQLIIAHLQMSSWPQFMNTLARANVSFWRCMISQQLHRHHFWQAADVGNAVAVVGQPAYGQI